MQKVFSLVLIAAALALSGCSTGTTSLTTELGGLETVGTDMGRFTAWALVEQKRLGTVAAVEKPPAAPQKPAVTVVLDSEEKIRTWTQYETTMALKEAVVELAKSTKPESKALAPTPFPKGAFAEGVDAVGGAAEKIAQAPGTVATVVGHFVSKTAEDGIDNAGDRQTINGSQNRTTSTKDMGTSVASATDSGAATAAPAVEVVRPEVVQPVIVQ